MGLPRRGFGSSRSRPTRGLLQQVLIEPGRVEADDFDLALLETDPEFDEKLDQGGPVDECVAHVATHDTGAPGGVRARTDNTHEGTALAAPADPSNLLTERE